MKIIQAVFLCLGSVHAVSSAWGGKGQNDDGGLHEVLDWLKANGATTSPGLRTDVFKLGGNNVRGLLTTQELSEKATFLVIPSRLWLLPSYFPKFAYAKLPPTCRNTVTQHELKFAAALAAETAKGNSSFYYTYLKHLPTSADFHSFFPRMMDATLQSDFAALPLVTSVRKSQARDKDIQKCFAMWAKESSSPARGLTWEHVHLALNWINTRAWGVEHQDTYALIPAADMLNTARPLDLKVNWWTSDKEFYMLTRSSVASGTQLLGSYCQDCDNSEMMNHWGVYLEDNPNPVEGNAEACAGKDGGHMKKVTQAALQDPASIASGWLSPRCRSSTLNHEQGPLRCSLARLAWETCKKHWGKDSTPNAALLGMAHRHEKRRALRGAQP